MVALACADRGVDLDAGAKMRRNSRKDRNHNTIAAFVSGLGPVLDVHCFPDIGCDLLLYFRGHSYHVEIKDGLLPPSARKLTDNEEASRRRCIAARVPYVVIRDIEEASCALGVKVCDRCRDLGIVNCGTVEGPVRLRAMRLGKKTTHKDTP